MEKGAEQPLVIIATWNEEEGIGPTMTELREVLPNSKFLIVDGNSTDKTTEIAENLGAEIIFQKGKGKGNAISQAIRHIRSDASCVIFIDADFTYPSEFLPEMIQILRENPEVGMVIGNRFNHSFDLRAMRTPYFVGNRFLAWAQRFLNGVNLNDPLTGMRVVRWQVLKNWKPKSECFDIEAEMNHRVENLGYETVEIPISYRSRVGNKKLKLKHGLTILRRIVMESIF